MNVLFMTSGSGTTVQYLAKHMEWTSSINLIGVVMEDNEFADPLEKKLSNYSSFELFLRVNQKQFNGKKEVYEYIYENIKGLKVHYIVLAGWMNIVPKEFITLMKNIDCKIINLHPSLQYQLIGKDIYLRIWDMYQEGMINKTGAMVHYIDEQVDRGTVIYEKILDLTTCKTFEEYKNEMYKDDGVEKICIHMALHELYEEFKKRDLVQEIKPSNFAKVELELQHRGKVRDIYTSRYYNNLLFINTSNRISANDIVISYVNDKGALLNQINIFWHKLFNLDQVVNYNTNGQLMIVKKFRPIPLEIIVRRKLYGSLWKEYQKGIRSINGYPLEDNMQEGDLFPTPIITPTTKGTKDKPITFEEILEWGVVNKKELDIICNMALQLFKKGENYMKYLGIEMIDTKFEFGFDKDGSIHFIDEVFTPDSSRFIVDGVKMDKDILRKWANDNVEVIMSNQPLEDGCRNVELPKQVTDRLYLNYFEFYQRITLGNNKTNFTKQLQFDSLDKNIIIIAGSKSDYEWVNKIRDELKKNNLISFHYYSSAHKNTLSVMKILEEWEHKDNVIYITVAGMSNALSGVISANTKHPVIACPPLIDKNDYMVNINSTLQMPSGVPACTILRPDNVAAFCKKIM